MIDLSMDLVIGLWWLLAFSVIVLFLGALNYFIGKSHSDIQITESQQTQQQSSRSTNRKKQARRQRQAAAAAAAKLSEKFKNEDGEDQQESKALTSERSIEQEEEEEDEEQEQEQEAPPAVPQLTDENEDQFDDPMTSADTTTSIQDEEEEEEEEAAVQQPHAYTKQKNKHKNNRSNSKPTNNETISSSKPQASVAPVKQSPANFNTYSHSDFNSLPPRFQQQRQQKKLYYEQRAPKKKTPKPSAFSDSFPLKQQVHHHHHQPLDLPLQTSNQNGYSSESDILTESSSTGAPHSTESQLSSSKRSDPVHSLSPANRPVDEFLSVFDANSFSTDELNLLLSQITKKYLGNQQDWPRPSKADKTLERILDETYRSQAKILAIELQTEKNRVLELSKANNELDQTLRQLQQPNHNMAPYHQALLHYQMQIRRLTNENAHLVHQLHAYSMMPATINELKQQQTMLSEQLRQLSLRNSHLEQEIADGERASKQAAEIYKKADTQKQERIEQMMTDLNKYKKIDRDLSALRTKHSEVEKSLTERLDSLIQERDQLKTTCEELQERVQEDEEVASEQDQISDLDRLQEELAEVQTKNDLLKQRNCKIIEQLNKFSPEPDENQ